MLRRMRWWFWFAAALLAGLAGSSWVAAGDAQGAYYGSPRASVSVSYFYDALAPYGRWVDYAPYGWCWTPSDVSVGWRPYSDGVWDYTDYGWTWVDNEPWGWGPYHYGRWIYEDGYGWLWVPGTEWAPAWVAWSADDNWVGWTPLPPGVDWNAGFGLSFVSFDVRRVPADNWCFVARRDLASPYLRTRILPETRNGAIFGHTQNVTQFSVHAGRPFNSGVNVASIERLSGRPVPRLRVADAASPRFGRERRAGNQLEMFRGRLSPAPRNAAPPMGARSAMNHSRGASPNSRLRQVGAIPRRTYGDIQRTQGRVNDRPRRDMGREPTARLRQSFPQRNPMPQRTHSQPVARERRQVDRHVMPARPVMPAQMPHPQVQRPQSQMGRPMAPPRGNNGNRGNGDHGGNGRGNGRGRDRG